MPTTRQSSNKRSATFPLKKTLRGKSYIKAEEHEKGGKLRGGGGGKGSHREGTGYEEKNPRAGGYISTKEVRTSTSG